MKYIKDTVDLVETLTETREKFGLPALSLITMNSESIIAREINGIRVYGTNNYVEPDDYFHIGSCSKSILAMIAAKMIEERKIAWDTKFVSVFPDLEKLINPKFLAITLLDLFLCRAGIQAFVSGDEKFPDIDSSAENQRYEFIKFLLQEEPVSKQKKNGKFEFCYSNASYTAAALVLEKISGFSYEDFLKNTFQSLGLKGFIGWPNRISADQPWGHMISKRETKIYDPGHNYQLNYLLCPAGDISLRPMDFAKYCQYNLQGLRGKDNYIRSESFKKLHFGYKNFSLGFANGKWNGNKFSGMDGSAGTFFCRAIFLPEIDFAFTIMVNAGSGKGQMKAVDWLTRKILKPYSSRKWFFGL